MSLKYVYEENNNLKKMLKAELIYSTVCMIMIFIVGLLFNEGNFALYLSLGIMLICILFIIITAILVYIFNKLKEKRIEKIKKDGQKEQGTIIAIHEGEISPRLYYRNIHWTGRKGYIVIKVEDKEYKIGDIMYNETFESLEKTYLMPSENWKKYKPFEIPIKVYKLNNEIFAQLDTAEVDKCI